MLNFDVTANTEDFNIKMQAVVSQVEKTAKVMQNLGKEFNLEGPEKQVSALRQVIAGNDQAIEHNATLLAKWQADAENAFKNGDWGTFEVITKDILDLSNEIQALTNETNTYKQALSEVESIAGMQQSQGEIQAPRFFANRADFNAAEELKSKIAELRQQIATFDGSEADLQGLKNQLLDMQTDLDGMNAKAAESASALGGELGGKAAETSTKLYALNKVISTQQKAVDSLKEELDKATEAYKSMDASANPEAFENARLKVDNLRSAYANATAELYNLKAARKDAAEQMGAVNAAIAAHNNALGQSQSTLVKMLGGYDNFQKMLSKLPAPLAEGIKGITGLTGAARIFIGTPLGIIVGALVLALQALYKWFKETSTGQMVLAKATGYLSGVMQGLKNIVFAVGKAIVSAFTDPKKAVSDFCMFVVKQVENRIKAVGNVFWGLGKIIQAAFTFDVDKITSALKDYANAWLQLGTGVEDGLGKIGGAINKLHKQGKEGASIAEDARNLAKERSQWEVEKAKIQRQIQEQYEKSRSNKYTTAQRQAANKQIRELNNRITQGDLSLNNKEISLQKRRMAMKDGNTSAEDTAKLNQLKKQNEELKTQGLQRNNALARLDNSLNTANLNALKKEKTLAEKRKKIQEDLNKTLETLYAKEEQTRVKSIEDSYEKRVAALRAAEKKAISEQIKTARSMSEKNTELGQGKNVTLSLHNGNQTDELRLTEEQQKVLQKIIDNANAARLQGEKELDKEMLDSHQSYTDKRLAIEKKYNDDIEALQKIREKAEKEGDKDKAEKADRSINAATSDKGKELMSLDFEELKKDPDYIRAFENLKNTSTETLSDLMEKMEAAKSEAAKVLNPEDLREYTDTIQQIMDEIDSRDIFGTLAKRAEELAKAKKDLAKAENQLEAVQNSAKIEKITTDANGKTQKSFLTLEEAQENYKAALDNSISKQSKYNASSKKATDTMKKFGSAISDVGNEIGGVAGQTISLIGDVVTFVSGSVDSIKTMSAAGANALSTIEKASAILAIIQAAIQVFNKLKSVLNGWFGADYSEYEKMKAQYEDLVDVWDELIDKKKEYIDISYGDEAKKAAKEAVALYEKEIESTRTLGKKYLNSGASAGSSSIGKRQWKEMTKEARQELKNLYGEEYEHTLGSVRMNKLFDMSADELRRLKENATTFWAGLSSSVRDYLDDIIKYDEAITETMDDAKEAVTGVSFDSFYDDWVSVLTDMDKGAKDLTDDFAENLKNALLQSLIANEYKSKIQALYDDWYDMYNEKGGDLTEADMKKLKQAQEDLAKEVLNYRDSLAKTFGWSATSQQEASSGAFQSMSEDTAQELNGRFTALQIAGESMATQAALGVEKLTLITDLQVSSNNYLSDILLQHALTNGHLESMVKYAKSMYADFGEKMDRIVNNTKNL